MSLLAIQSLTGRLTNSFALSEWQRMTGRFIALRRTKINPNARVTSCPCLERRGMQNVRYFMSTSFRSSINSRHFAFAMSASRTSTSVNASWRPSRPASRYSTASAGSSSRLGSFSEIILVHRFDRIDLARIFVYTYILHIYIIPKKNNKKLKKNLCFLLVIYVFLFFICQKMTFKQNTWHLKSTWHLNKHLTFEANTWHISKWNQVRSSEIKWDQVRSSDHKSSDQKSSEQDQVRSNLKDQVIKWLQVMFKWSDRFRWSMIKC